MSAGGHIAIMRAGSISRTALLIVFLLAAGCASKPPVPIEDIRDRYAAGMQKLTSGDPAGAEKIFLALVLLSKDIPYGNTGMAYVSIERNRYKEALRYADHAIDADHGFVDALAAKGRALTLRARGNNWFAEAHATLAAALGIDPANPRVLYYLGEAYLKSLAFNEALAVYREAAKGGGQFAEAAAARIPVIEPFAGRPPANRRVLAILIDDRIDRSDLCVLLCDDLNLQELLRTRRPEFFSSLYDRYEFQPMAVPQDLVKHQDEHMVCDLLPLRLGDLGIHADLRFYPDRIINRADLALVLQDVLVLVGGDEYLSTHYRGAASPFPDVRPDYYAFNAIMVCAERGIVAADAATGAFRPQDPVNGCVALGAVRRVEALLQENQ